MNETQENSNSSASIVYWQPETGTTIEDLNARQRLIETGWRLLDSTALPKAFCGATSARVSETAGVTTGSFFHHFPNAEAFANAMASELANSLAATDLTEVKSVAANESGSIAIDLMAMIRSNFDTVWNEFTTDETRLARFRIQMRLWSHHRLTLDSGPDPTTIGDVIRKGYLRSQMASLAMWEPILAVSGREIAEPFDMQSIAVIASAVFEGLTIRAAIDPGSVPPTLLGESIAALVGAVTRPAGRRVVLGEESFEIHPAPERAADQSPQARSGAQRRYETRTRIVAAAIGMFAEGWESVSASEVAARANVSTQTITNLFGSVRAVAATTFGHHARQMYQNALSGSKSDPARGLRDSLIDLVVRTRSDPEAARALLAERVAAAVQHGKDLGRMDIRLEVPISGALGLWLSRMGLLGDVGLTTSTTLANFVLTNAIVTNDSPQQIASTALRLLPETSERRTVGH